ncbi:MULTISPECIES: MerR family transcriptional regulator [unclassified Parasphingorhabdus]|jgi:MerR family mercuric resistance operon transcriptional regulator|uniref:MerR family transcriptional regulator n=1 Tax=Parasphingorhabdus sp. TaxID=2709688 RepID=UPI003D27982F|tara:strand:+ start:507 stop:905 length:399 start_codon:yes stop_codon:yes gene_type:complete
MQPSVKRGKLAKIAGCNVETIRYYENIELLRAVDRTSSGHRVYSSDDQARLRFILRARELGFSIAELRGLLSLVDSKEYTCGEVLAVTNDHITNIQQKISDLKRLEQTLSDMAQKCDGGEVPDCAIVDAMFH